MLAPGDLITLKLILADGFEYTSAWSAPPVGDNHEFDTNTHVGTYAGRVAIVLASEPDPAHRGGGTVMALFGDRVLWAHVCHVALFDRVKEANHQW